MSKVSVVKVAGPLAAYAPGFGRELKDRGYTEVSVTQQLRLVAHVSRWLDAEGVEVPGFTTERIEAFCTARRGAGYTRLLTPRALRPLQEFLESHGVVPPFQASQPMSAEQLLLDRYQNYLVTERGMVEQGVLRWVQAAERFLADHPGLADGTAELKASGVSAFCARELPQRAGSSAKNLAAALRSFLKFLHVEGLLAAPLAQAVPPVAGSVGAGLPRAVPPATLTALLASCDRRTTTGRRDYAIMLLLARLGLRAGEVALLSLDDIDWANGELVVHGKGGRDERLPLPHDVGAAVAGYMRWGRPRAETRAVFLRAIAPAVGLTPGGVTSVVYTASERAGVPRVGAHRLRHGCATEMLAAGASLGEIGQVLRHAAVSTTAIYAKVDFVALRPLARPWPRGAA
jgi:site-specific recombinase XerD